jgi:hypothetical protein
MAPRTDELGRNAVEACPVGQYDRKHGVFGGAWQRLLGGPLVVQGLEMDLCDVPGVERGYGSRSNVRWKPRLPVVAAVKQKANGEEASRWTVGRRDFERAKLELARLE